MPTSTALPDVYRRFAAVQQQDREEGTLPSAAQFELLPPLDRLEPAKYSKLHAPLPTV